MSRQDLRPPRAAETLPDACPAGSVVLDIGGDIGAAVVTTGADLDNAEIEIRPQEGQWTGKHVAVLERQVAGGPVFAAVFPSLPAGVYHLRVRTEPADGPVHSIVVNGGQVLTTCWPHL
jgi:hypothetical protein